MIPPMITAPDQRPDNLSGPTVFLAGGISGCVDWAPALRAHLADTQITLVNPRRDDTIEKAGPEAAYQIWWEHAWLTHPDDIDVISFWFPHETLCPITLLELGKALTRTDVRVVVGCHPDYQRRFDVIEQTRLERPEITVVDNLHDLAGEIRAAAVRTQMDASADLSVCLDSIRPNLPLGPPEYPEGILTFRQWYEAWQTIYGGLPMSGRTERVCGLHGAVTRFEAEVTLCEDVTPNQDMLDIAAQELI